MNADKVLRKLQKNGATTKQLEYFGKLQEIEVTFPNGKVGYFADDAFWYVRGYDDASQETERRFFDNVTQLIKWGLAD